MNNINYDTQALSQQLSRFGIAKTRLAKLFRQTNNLTVNRWISGGDIYLSSLLTIVNTFGIEFMSFFSHDGHPFATRIADIALMEEAGLRLPDILQQHGIEPTSDSPSAQRRHTADTGTAEGGNPPTAQHIAGAEILPGDILDRFLKFQCAAHEHEQQALQRQQDLYQQMIADKDKQIASMEKELKRLRVIENASIPYHSMAADDSMPYTR